MAEAVAISLSAKLAMMLSRNAAISLSPLFSIRSDIATTKHDLDLLHAFLRFADSQKDTDLAAEWVKQIRDATFELEDVADESCYVSSNGRGWVNVSSWFALSRRLRKARERLCYLFSVKEQYGIRLADGPALPVATVCTSRMLADSAHFMKKEEIFGFDGHAKKLLEWLAKDDDEKQRTLVAVCGMGGVGKTTLVTRVYKEMAAATTSHHLGFECAAWVAVSQGFTVEDLLRKILMELHRDSGASGSNGGSNDMDTDDYRSLMEALRGRLGTRRYLVVLDDVWDANLWAKFLDHVFPDNATGSRVVITTRSREVAQAAAPERTMMLEPLPWSEAWTLFCNVAFRDVPGRTCPTHLEEPATDMLKRCRGLPLAIVSIANLPALKDTTEHTWRKVLDRIVRDKSRSDLGIGHDAASILNLSIDDLPHHLKKCFLSCSIYCEDFLMKRKILIRQWIAHGFIEEKQEDQRTPEDVADDYLDQLVQRNLIKAVIVNEFGRAKSCIIHDLIRELIIRRSREEEGFSRFVNSNIPTDNNVRIRHLVVDRCEDVDSLPVWPLAALRSFQAFKSGFDSAFISNFRLLIVLNLWSIGINKLPSSVTELHNLRYIGFRNTFVTKLPKHLGKLQKLQTLDAKWSMVQKLPSSTAKLKNLRHLILSSRQVAQFSVKVPGMAVGVPYELGNLCNLQTLKYVRADKNMVRSLARLQQMRSLDLSGLDGSTTAVLSSSISRMSCLLRLGLEVEPTSDAVLDLESVTRPPVKLQKLHLKGRLARGNVPSWTCSLRCLTKLRLCNCEIAQDSLVLLAKLPRLLNLTLVNAWHGMDITFSAGSFPTLQRLVLQEFPHLRHIEFQEGCLVKLQDLVLIRCRNLIETPQGMEHLSHLQNLNLFGLPDEFVNQLKQLNGSAAYYKPDNSEFLRIHGPVRRWRWREEIRNDILQMNNL